MRARRRLSLAIMIGALAAAAAGGCAAGGDAYMYVPPQDLADGLRVADARVMGLDTSRIGAVVRDLRGDRFGIHSSLLVVKDGSLIIEEYFGEGDGRQLQGVQSVSKSITSLLVGHALAEGWIESIDDPIAKYLPSYRHLLTGGKERITIRHLLTMTSGLDWNEWDLPYSDSTNVRVRERNSADAVAFVLSRPLATQPGEAHVYNGGGMTVLGEIVKNASGLSSDALVTRAFDGLLDSTEIRPAFQKDGRLNAAGGFQLTPRGMAKIGQMILQRGIWNGDTLFDPGWIRESTDAVMDGGHVGYGSLWWRHAITVGDRAAEAVVASGLGGQYIVVIPDLDTVIIVTADNYETQVPVDSVIDHVLPVLGPFPPAATRAIDSTAVSDSASASPPSNAGWTEIVSEPNPSNGGARIRVAVDTSSARRLDDGSHLLWFRFAHEKPVSRGGITFDSQTSRLILPCETPTDGRYKSVGFTRILKDGAPVSRYGVELPTAMSQPWKRAWGGSLDLDIFQAACRQVIGIR